MKATFFRISIDLFNHDVVVFINHDGKKLRSVYRRLGAAPAQMREIDSLATWWDKRVAGRASSATTGCAHSTPDGCVVLLLLDDDRETTSMIVSHEMAHAALMVMTGAAIKWNESTEEILAYLVGFLTSKAMRGIDRFARTKKAKGAGHGRG